MQWWAFYYGLYVIRVWSWLRILCLPLHRARKSDTLYLNPECAEHLSVSSKMKAMFSENSNKYYLRWRPIKHIQYVKLIFIQKGMVQNMAYLTIKHLTEVVEKEWADPETKQLTCCWYDISNKRYSFSRVIFRLTENLLCTLEHHTRHFILVIYMPAFVIV